jgi:hypothetical protein
VRSPSQVGSWNAVIMLIIPDSIQNSSLLIRERLADTLIRKRHFVTVDEYLTRFPSFKSSLTNRPGEPWTACRSSRRRTLNLSSLNRRASPRSRARRRGTRRHHRPTVTASHPRAMAGEHECSKQREAK